MQLEKGHKFLNKGTENIFNKTTEKEQEIILFITASKIFEIRYSKEVEDLYNESFIIPNEGFEEENHKNGKAFYISKWIGLILWK